MAQFSGIILPTAPIFLKFKKRVIRVIMNPGNRDCCHQLFMKLKILPLKLQYIFSLLLFVAKNNDLYKFYLLFIYYCTLFRAKILPTLCILC